MSKWDLTDFERVVVWSGCLDWIGHRVWEWRTQDSCWLVLHCQANQLMSAWSISLSSSQQRLTLPAQNQPNLMGMIHRGWRPKFTFSKMWECVGDLSVVYALVTHQQHVFTMTRTFSITPSLKCLQTIWPSWCRRKRYLLLLIDRCNKRLGIAIRFSKFVLWHHA